MDINDFISGLGGSDESNAALSDYLGGGDNSISLADLVGSSQNAPAQSISDLLGYAQDNSSRPSISDLYGAYSQASPSPAYASPQDYQQAVLASIGAPAVAQEPSVMDTLNQWGTAMQTPGGKLATGAAGAGLGLLGSYMQAQRNKAAYEQAMRLKAAAQGLNNAPLARLAMTRQAVAAPQNRRGEAAYFTGNALPKFAEGGSVDADGNNGNDEQWETFARGGSTGLINGNSSGQSDQVPFMGSSGEFVMPADVVSHLGDGNNAAGALKLHALMTGVRKHKGAPKGLPPIAKPPQAYMRGAK